VYFVEIFKQHFINNCFSDIIQIAFKHRYRNMTASSNTNAEKEIEDPVERMLKKTGCIELHYQVQVHLLITSLQYRLILMKV